MSDQPASAPADVPVLTLITKLKNREFQAAVLSAEDRRRCVEVLRTEGYTLAEIAQILGRNERTIRRDMEQIRSERALEPQTDFVQRMVGELVAHGETSIAHLRRIAREQGASAMERAMAESFGWKVARELIDKLQSLGYLPRVPAGIVADVFQHADADVSAGYEMLVQQICEVSAVAGQVGEGQSERVARCEKLLDAVRQARVTPSPDLGVSP